RRGREELWQLSVRRRVWSYQCRRRVVSGSRGRARRERLMLSLKGVLRTTPARRMTARRFWKTGPGVPVWERVALLRLIDTRWSTKVMAGSAITHEVSTIRGE